MRFLLMKKHGYRVYVLADAEDEVLASIVFSSGAQYRFPFAGKEDLIYGPSYTVPEHRGNGYAYLACLMILPVAKQHKMTKLYLACSYDSIASIKTIEKLGGNFIEEIIPPPTYIYFRKNIKPQKIYKLDI